MNAEKYSNEKAEMYTRTYNVYQRAHTTRTAVYSLENLLVSLLTYIFGAPPSRIHTPAPQSLLYHFTYASRG